jgi:hypothetical protein
LDRRVFGVLKAYARQLWRTQYHASHGQKTTREQAAANLCEAWERITEALIQDAWSIYDGEDWTDLINGGDDEADLMAEIGRLVRETPVPPAQTPAPTPRRSWSSSNVPPEERWYYR